MAERPIECSECKKKIQVTYKEIAKGKCSCLEMCSECPILEKKLHGQSDLFSSEANLSSPPKLYCAVCMTTAETIQMGNTLGCIHCYEVFEELLTKKLLSERCLPNSGNPLHLGKNPNQPLTLPLSSQIATLNGALNNALKKEQYEQAAWLRDEIQVLKEKASERKKSSP